MFVSTLAASAVASSVPAVAPAALPAIQTLPVVPSATAQAAVNAFIATHAERLEKYAGHELAERKLTGRVDGKEILDQAYTQVMQAAANGTIRSISTAALKSYFKTAIANVIQRRPKLSEGWAAASIGTKKVEKRLEYLGPNERGKRVSIADPHALEGGLLATTAKKDGSVVVHSVTQVHVSYPRVTLPEYSDPNLTEAELVALEKKADAKADAQHQEATKLTPPLDLFIDEETPETVAELNATVDKLMQEAGALGISPQQWERFILANADATFTEIARTTGVPVHTSRRNYLAILAAFKKRGITLADIKKAIKYLPDLPVTGTKTGTKTAHNKECYGCVEFSRLGYFGDKPHAPKCYRVRCPACFEFTASSKYGKPHHDKACHLRLTPLAPAAPLAVQAVQAMTEAA